MRKLAPVYASTSSGSSSAAIRRKVSSFFVFEGEAAWIEATEAWDRAPEAFARMREFDGPRRCRPIVWRSALLEGRWLAATGRLDAAVRELQAARGGTPKAR